MSVKLVAIRHITCVNLIVGSDVSPERTYIEAFFVGYSGSAGRTRLKRFRDVPDTFQYLNKLLQGGWQSDEDHLEAWNAVLDLDSRMQVLEYEKTGARSSVIPSIADCLTMEVPL